MTSDVEAKAAVSNAIQARSLRWVRVLRCSAAWGIDVAREQRRRFLLFCCCPISPSALTTAKESAPGRSTESKAKTNKKKRKALPNAHTHSYTHSPLQKWARLLSPTAKCMDGPADEEETKRLHCVAPSLLQRAGRTRSWICAPPAATACTRSPLRPPLPPLTSLLVLVLSRTNTTRLCLSLLLSSSPAHSLTMQQREHST